MYPSLVVLSSMLFSVLLFPKSRLLFANQVFFHGIQCNTNQICEILLSKHQIHEFLGKIGFLRFFLAGIGENIFISNLSLCPYSSYGLVGTKLIRTPGRNHERGNTYEVEEIRSNPWLFVSFGWRYSGQWGKY